MEITNPMELNSASRSFLSTIFTVSQIKCTRYQNQSTDVHIFPWNLEKKYESKKCAYQQFQISIRSNRGNIHQTKCFENKVLNEVTAEPQKKQYRQFEQSRSQPNFAGGRKSYDTCNKSKIKQHRNATLLRFNHLFYENILQSKKKSSANRNAIQDIKPKFIVRIQGCYDGQSDEADQSRNPSKTRDVFSEKNFRQNQRKQRNCPKNSYDFRQWQFNNGVNVKKKTYCSKNSAHDIQKKLICFKCRFALSNYKGQQGNQSEKKPEKSHLKCTQPLSHKFRNNIVDAADKHLTEKKHNSLPIFIQNHKISDEKSRLFITFMVKNENIF